MRHLRAFLTIARLNNFTRAASELHVSQSALTVQIRQLEDALGVLLFDRSKRRVALTQAGKEVLAPLERIVIDTEAVISHTRDMAGLRRGFVSVAVLPSLSAGLLPAVLQEFTKKHPAIPVQIKDMVAERVIDAVKKEEVDFGVGTRMKRDPELKTTPLFTDRLSAFVPKSHPLVRRSRITLRELTEHPLVLTSKGSSVREILEAALRKEKLSVLPAFEVNYMSTVIGLVKAGLGIAILPAVAENIQASAGITRVEIINPALNRTVEIIEKKGRSPSHAASSMLAALKRAAASY
ncbi:MAG TPA: LysR family transcriptional regulator [Terriglobales bacterium]|nr:LysR family transcriptional regulator [Terriglobales bacterium]